MRHRIRTPALLLALTAGAAGLLAPPALAARSGRARDPSGPQVRILGFTTHPRLPGVAVQAKPGTTLTACYVAGNDQRDMNVIWQGRGIDKGTKVGVALWGGDPRYSPEPSEPANADVMRTGSNWRHRASETHRSEWGYSFAGGPFGPVSIDGQWTAKIVIKGRVVARKAVTIACA